eukprot:1505558-Heterocapsa_arctica.AAC.1
MKERGMIPLVEKKGMIPSKTTMKEGLIVEIMEERGMIPLFEKKGMIPSKTTMKEGLNIEDEDGKKRAWK